MTARKSASEPRSRRSRTPAGTGQAIPARAAPSALVVGSPDLRQVQTILPQLIDALTDAILVVDRTRRVVAANRRYHQIFSEPGKPLVGTLCRGHPGCPEASVVGPDACATCEVLRDGEPARRMRMVQDARGACRRWEGTFNPVRAEASEVSHVVEVWRDVSERSRLESQLSHSERLASLGILAAGVAHEINNPLAAVLAGVEALQRRCGQDADGAIPRAADAETRALLGVLERETRRCREITDKLMLLAQPSSVAPEWVDLNRSAHETLSLLRFQVKKQRITAVEDLDPLLERIWAKESGMRGICMNLLLNAVQVMPRGGTLTVRTRSTHVGAILTVEDTGPGIADEIFDRIWDPFFTTKPPGLGTGLGLSITHGIVSRHGGSIHAENRPEGGARFVVELPRTGPGGLDG